MKPVTWGVLSVSKHYTQRVHPAICGSAAIEVRAIASRSFARAQEAASRLNIEKAYDRYEDILSDINIEAVYIPLPNNLHTEWIKASADAGKHILCEKPLAMSAHEAEDAVRYAESRGVKIMEAFMYRFHPQWQKAKDIIACGELGEVHSITIQYAYTNRDPKNIRNIPEAGGGAIMDIGCYAVSAIRFLLGAEPGRVLSLIHRDPEFKTDILSSAILDYGKARAVFTVSTTSWPGQKVEIRGTEGEISFRLPYNAFADVPAQLDITTRMGARTVSFPPVNQYTLMFEAFCDAIRNYKPVPTPPQDAVRNMKVIDALFRSEVSGAWETP
ncbi:MAG: Gfo/Idh/MocA family oxidoreductase [Spirochaetales bacterium]|jgi:predicted dehydrogenase|nr:Gfo/Idh/MocA family oxidoreductase [Spirochaetales bacterium]